MSSTLEARTLDSAELLTQITGQQVLNRDLTPRIMFLSSMATVLVGVAYADGQLADREKIYLQKLLSQFVSPKSSFGKMISRMLKGVHRHKIYTRPEALSCLTSSLSVSEKLVILGFGCRLATADGHAETKERQYLETIASDIDIAPQQIKALFSCLSGKQSEVDQDTVEELRRLLDPQRFQNIDVAIVGAASFLSSKLLAHQRTRIPNPASCKPSYAKLERFQCYRKQLSSICEDIARLLETGGEYNIFPSVLEEKVRKLTQKVQSQKFRLAVVGEFSQGKSTFLNALLGEELQPVRAIPCSGTLTVLKYGPKKQAVCHYKDGTQSAIAFDQYQQLASIPKEAALGSRRAKLEESNLIEIVLEHPGLELCRHHVEIVDSPGLNEHPERTAVTNKLLENADAAIFLTNASRAMSQGERDLLQSLKHRLQAENTEGPADNLFVLVNFMDLLQEQEDKAEVSEMVKNFVCNPAAPLVNSDNRVHFISAKSALAAMLTQTTNEYSRPFSEFVSALETFLVVERGEISLRKEIADVQEFILGTRDSLEQIEKLLEGKIRLSSAERQKILEQIGEISGFSLKIRRLKKPLMEEAQKAIEKSWNNWIEDLYIRLSAKSTRWRTYHEDRAKAFMDYRDQSIKDIAEDVDRWRKGTVKECILKPKLYELERDIVSKLSVIEDDLRSIDNYTGASLYEQFELSSLDTIQSCSKEGSDRAMSDVSKSIVLNPIPFMITSWISSWISGENVEKIRDESRAEALNSSVEQFIEASDDILEKLAETVKNIFNKKAQDFQELSDAVIAILCNLLKQQESVLEETLEQIETETILIQEKSIQLKAIEVRLNDLIKTALN